MKNKAVFSRAQQSADPDLAYIKSHLLGSLLPPDGENRERIREAAVLPARSLRPNGTWADVAYENRDWSNWGPAAHLARIHLLGKAGAIFTSEKSKASTEVKAWGDAARSALGWWVGNDPQCPNWWWNQIGVPEYLGEILLFLGDDLSPTTREKVLQIMTRSKSGGTGANLVWLAESRILRGILMNDPQPVAEAYQQIYGEIRLVNPNQEGIQEDYSFHQHGAQFYSGGYGLTFGNDCARYTAAAWGTRFQIPSDTMRRLTSYLLDGQQWMIRGGTFDYSALGREITRQGKVAAPRSWVTGPIAPTGAAYAMPQSIRMLASLSMVPRRAEFVAFAERLSAGDAALPRREVTGCRYFWQSGYLAHRRNGFFASVRAYSTRIQNTETTNGEGKTLHHIADGTFFLYRRGDEYRDIFPLWDWRKVPGTTAEQDDPPLHAIGAVTRRGPSEFVGGVSDDRYGVFAQDFQRDTLTARKAWFCFDDEIVCLGAGISCKSRWPIATTINQCWLRKGETVERDGDRWVLHDEIGYLFPIRDPKGSKANARAEVRTGRWADIGTGTNTPVSGKVFTVWFDHGIQPMGKQSEYACIVIPGTTTRALRARAALPRDPIQIIANTAAVQAVRHTNGVLLAAFYEAGHTSGTPGWQLRADHPCTICLRENRDTGRLRIAVSNPTNRPATVTLTLDRRLSGEGIRTTEDGATLITFVLPEGAQGGNHVIREFSQKV